MNKREQFIINNYEQAVEALASLFVEKYFPEEDYEIDCYWVAGRIGEVFFVSEMFFNVDRMFEAIELQATFDQLYDYYHRELEAAEEGRTIQNFKNYVKYGLSAIE